MHILQPKVFIPAMLIGTTDFYNFIPLLFTLTLPGGHKVSTTQNLLTSFSRTLRERERERERVQCLEVGEGAGVTRSKHYRAIKTTVVVGVTLSCHNHYPSDFCTCCKHYLSDFGVLLDIIDFYSSNTYPIGYMQFFQLHIFSYYGKIFNRNSHNN